MQEHFCCVSDLERTLTFCPILLVVFMQATLKMPAQANLGVEDVLQILLAEDTGLDWNVSEASQSDDEIACF